MPEAQPITVLHYVGYDEDRGGILAVIRALAAEKRFRCMLGVNDGFKAGPSAALEVIPFSPVAGDVINLVNIWRARRVAGVARAWLQADPSRIFHGHSRAGLLVALWLRAWGERRVMATVHCYGRQRWFYRWAAGRLRERIRWLTPAMKRYYGVGDDTWIQCLPGCVRPADWPPKPRRSGGAEIVFGCVGGLVPVKQWELVLRALHAIPPETPLRVLHAGGEDGSAQSARYGAGLRELASGLDRRIEWQGGRRDIAAFYEQIDCLIIASRFEAFSVAALEAGLRGVPVLAADAAGNQDLVRGARLGWLFQPDCAEALAAEMQKLAGARSELSRWKFDAAAFQRFTAESVAAEHLKIYGALVRNEL